MPNQDLTAAAAATLFDYDPQTGALTWKLSPSQAVKAGAFAGSKNNSGHLQVTIKGKTYSAHRVVWLLAYGEWPSRQVDHLNRNPSDNRLANLRLATSTENRRNRGKQKNNRSGKKGVHIRGDQYRAQIQVNGVVLSLGTFASLEEASQAYKTAAQKHFGSFAAD